MDSNFDNHITSKLGDDKQGIISYGNIVQPPPPRWIFTDSDGNERDIIEELNKMADLEKLTKVIAFAYDSITKDLDSIGNDLGNLVEVLPSQYHDSIKEISTKFRGIKSNVLFQLDDDDITMLVNNKKED